MKKTLAVLAGVTALSTFAMAESFELGLVSPIQVASPEASIDGFRLSTIWTVNQDVKVLTGHGLLLKQKELLKDSD